MTALSPWPHLLLGSVFVVASVSCVVHSAQNANDFRNVSFDVSPKGDMIVFSALDGRLYLLDLGKQKVRQLTETAAQTPRFSPNGASIVYAANDTGGPSSSVFERPLRGGDVRRLTDARDVRDMCPVYSRDGSMIAFVRASRYRARSMGGFTWGDWDIYLMTSSAKHLRRVTRENYYLINPPSFAPDGRSLLYAAMPRSTDNPVTSICEVNVNGDTPPERLLLKMIGRKGAWYGDPTFSPDGQQIAFVSDQETPFQYDVFLAKRDGTKPRPLGMEAISKYNRAAVFSPNGNTIFVLSRDERYQDIQYGLWQVDTAKKTHRRIASSELFSNPLSWRPMK